MIIKARQRNVPTHCWLRYKRGHRSRNEDYRDNRNFVREISRDIPPSSPISFNPISTGVIPIVQMKPRLVAESAARNRNP